MVVLIRPYEPDDAPGVVDLYERTSAKDPNVAPIRLDGWQRFVRQDVNQSGSGFFVAADGQGIVAVASSSLRCRQTETVRHFRIIVEPAYRRRGIGVQLLTALLGLDTERPETLMQSVCPKDWHAGRDFLERLGFAVVETEFEMSCVEPLIHPLPPEGDLRVARVEDTAAYAADVARLHNVAYAEDVSFVAFTAASMTNLLEGAELWILWRGDSVAGYCHVEPSSNFSWIESLVVDATHRNQRLGTRLGAVVIDDIVRRRGHTVRLSVSDRNPAARKVYQNLGFKEIDSSLRYRAPRRHLAALGIGT